MHKILDKLHRDHINLNWLLDLLTKELDSFFAGNESDFDLKIELLEYLEIYAELSHHPTEDVIFEAAMKKTDKKQAVLERLMDQHQRLTRATRNFRKSLEGVVQGGVMLRDELEVQGREFIALQRLHLDTEEQEVFPFLDKLFSKKQWEQIEAKIPDVDDPVFGKRDPNRFRVLVRYLAEKED
jgi:hemerythrin-like domain-containing protein